MALISCYLVGTVDNNDLSQFQKPLEQKATEAISILPEDDMNSEESIHVRNDHDVLWLIYELRKRLGWPYKGIELGEQPVAKRTVDTTVKEYADDGQFQYCLERGHCQPKAQYNPYDLIVTSPDVVDKCDKYYTVSATYVTMVRISIVFPLYIASNSKTVP